MPESTSMIPGTCCICHAASAWTHERWGYETCEIHKHLTDTLVYNIVHNAPLTKTAHPYVQALYTMSLHRDGLKYHVLSRCPEGWTYVQGSYTSESARQSAIDRKRMSYKDAKFAPLDTENYAQMRKRVQDINIAQKTLEGYKAKFPNTTIL